MRSTVAARLPTAVRVAGSYTPLSERVLGQLPGPRPLWLIGWGLSPFVAYEVAHLVAPQMVYLGVLSNLGYGLVNLIGLWGVGRLARRMADLQPALERLLPPEQLDDQHHPFRHAGSLVGPLALSAVVAGGWDLVDFLARPNLATAVLVGVIFVFQLGIATFMWTYVVGLVALDRLGRRQLRVAPFATDPSLGLRSLGGFAFEAFLVASAVTVPIFVAGAADPRGFVGALLALVLVGALFFLSAIGLHRMLVAAKAGHVRWAHRLVEVALDPIAGLPADVGPRLAQPALEQAATRLAAAVEVERRALAIHEWPFDPAIVRTVAAILTSATAAIGARVLLSQLGI